MYLFPKKIKGSFAVLQKLIKDPYVQEDIYYLKYRLDNICVMVTNARLQRMNFSNQFDYIINANTNEVFPAFVTMIYFSWSKFLFKKSTTGDIGVNVPFKNQQIINSLPPHNHPTPVILFYGITCGGLVLVLVLVFDKMHVLFFAHQNRVRSIFLEFW